MAQEGYLNQTSTGIERFPPVKGTTKITKNAKNTPPTWGIDLRVLRG